jgi:hypothetical protein
MRPAVFGALWCFTTLAAGYDTYFAWQHQAGFELWELNPFICWLASVGGLKVVIGLKIGTTAFAMGLALLCRWSHHWLERPLTLVVAGIFVFLSLYYVIAASKALDPSVKIVEPSRKVAGSFIRLGPWGLASMKSWRHCTPDNSECLPGHRAV